METMNLKAWGLNPEILLKFGLSFAVLLKDDGKGGGGTVLMGFESKGRGSVMKAISLVY